MIFDRFFISSKRDWYDMYAASPVIASILLTPVDIPVSLVILNNLISEVLETCVPPHNSIDFVPILTTLTLSLYFSSKNANAPSEIASLYGTVFSDVFLDELISKEIIDSILESSSLVKALLWEKSNRKYSSVTIDPFCSTCSPSVSLNA